MKCERHYVVTSDLSSDAYDTSRLGIIIRDSEGAFYQSRIECEKTVRQIESELDRHALLIDPEISNPNPETKINYVAIDGTRDILEGQTHARLFAGAFAVYGEFNKTVDITEIQRSCAFSVVSLPYKILTSGNDYITESAGSVTNLLMLLAEIYVAKTYADNDSKDLDLILLDRPLCGTLAHTRTALSQHSILKKLGAKNIQNDKNLDSAIPIFEDICKRLFVESLAEPLKIEGEHLSSDDLMYLCRVGLNALFKICREKNIELVGVTKTTNDCSFLRLLITLNAMEGRDTKKIYKILSQIDDCKMLGSWISPYQKLVCTREYDTALMTIMVDESKKLRELGGGGQAPQKLIVRSYMSFGLPNKGGFVFAVERLVLKKEKTPTIMLPKNTEIYLYAKEGNKSQLNIFHLLKNMCTGAFPEALYYPLPLALAHRFAKSNFDYIRPRLKATSRVFGTEYGFNDLKREFT